jgi:hypothetical protein
MGLPDSVAVGDFSCDGVPDLALANYNGFSDSVAILEGNGSGAFTNAVGSPFPAGGNPSSALAGDFNGDGSPDVAVVNPGQDVVTVLQNETSGGTCGEVASHAPPYVSTEGPGSTPSRRSGQPVPTIPPTEVVSLAALAHTVSVERGLRLEVTLSNPGSVMVELQRRVVKLVRGRRRKLLETVGSVTLEGKAGANAFTIKRVDGRPLAPGNYTLLVFTNDEGRRSAVHTLNVRVKR